MTRTTALVITVSLLLLGGAWFASRAIVADVKAPPAPIVSEPAAPVFVPRTDVAPSARPDVKEVVVPPRPVAVAAAPAPPELPPPSPSPAEEFTPEEREVNGIAEQGWAHLKDLRGGTATWRKAEKLFERCLFLSAEDQRCKQGLETARQRLRR